MRAQTKPEPAAVRDAVAVCNALEEPRRCSGALAPGEARTLTRKWYSLLRLFQPAVLAPQTRGGQLVIAALKQDYGGWLPTILAVDGPAVCAGRLARWGIACPLDVTTRY